MDSICAWDKENSTWRDVKDIGFSRWGYSNIGSKVDLDDTRILDWSLDLSPEPEGKIGWKKP